MMLVHVFFTLLYCIQAFQEGWCIIIIDEPLFCMGTYRRRFRRSFSTKTSVFSGVDPGFVVQPFMGWMGNEGVDINWDAMVVLSHRGEFKKDHHHYQHLHYHPRRHPPPPPLPPPRHHHHHLHYHHHRHYLQHDPRHFN